MDELPMEEESHAADEALLVLDGRLELEVNGTPLSVRAGELYMVAAGTAAQGSLRKPRHAGDRGAG
ncbi:cupin domain-containing protein [Streptacidiphilus neutrinimicus]|uniref:cupin domain-containing protein n=1 Tax=Streptacidiphilus neutrinimicus TaxID=105420 RepID=UPI0034E20728